ncbi:MAG: sugar nucleotide-binding protein [Planctomycetales bacterium]|nr:sugar nucleotide-binding protein [Planctomycetales bacterium]
MHPPVGSEPVNPPDSVDDIPLPLLITGVAGVPGYNAFHYFRQRFPGQVIGLRRVDNWPLRGDDIVACDTHDHDGLARLFDRYQFRSVLNSEGSCALRACELDPLLAWRVNVLGVKNLIEQLAGRDTRLIHLSIDLVFSGDKGGDYLEEDPTDPVTVYGKTMVLGEQMLLTDLPESCILRISLPMGISFNGHAGAIDWIQSRFKKNKPATLYFDEVRTPAYTDCLNRLYATLLKNRLRGLFHAGGPVRLSLYEIAQIINRVGGYDPRHLMGCPRHAAGPIPPRAGNVTMNSSKLAAALGYAPLDPWPHSPSLIPTDPAWHHHRPADEPAGPEQLAAVLYRNPKQMH